MRWTINNVMTKAEGTIEEFSALSNYLSYHQKTYSPFHRRYNVKLVSLVHPLTGEFLTGLGKAAYDEMKRLGIPVQFTDARGQPSVLDDWADLEWLKHHPAVQGEITHQVAAVQAAKKYKRGILWLPTGAGKTEIAIGIAKVYIGVDFLFLVHSADLLMQTMERYHKRTGLPAGIIGDGKLDIPIGCKFIVAMFQTLHSAIKSNKEPLVRIMQSIGGIIVDECHSSPAESHVAVLNHLPNAYYRYGLSATPLARDDESNLLTMGTLGPVIYRVLPDELIKIGLLAAPDIKLIEVSQFSGRPTWNGVYTECVTKSRKRNMRLLDIVKQAAKPCLVFVTQVKHGKALCSLLERNGLKAEFAWGEKETQVRHAALKRLERGETEVLVANVIFQLGIDLPSLKSVVIATGGKSVIAALQRIGRGMRADAATAKTTFEVYDIFDKGCGCTEDKDRDDPPHIGCRILEKHSKERLKAYRSEGFTPQIVKDKAETGNLPGV